MSQLISIIIPCFRSEHYLETTVLEILELFSTQNKYTAEIILVDDGSPDQTYRTIQTLCHHHPEIIGIRLSRNYGQARARMAGLSYAKGDCIVFMDDDGQHPASGILSLSQKIFEDYDLVYSQFPTQKESFFRRLSSKITNRCLTAVTKKPANVKITSFFAISRFAADALARYQSPYIFLGGYLFEITKRVTTVEIQHRSRINGTSTYTFKKLYSMWLDNMLAFPTVPAGIIRKTGYLTSILGVILLIVALIKTSANFITWGLITLGFGILFILLGILGEILMRSYLIMQGVPTYLIREITKHDIL